MEEKERYVIRYDLEYIQCLIDTEKNQGVGDYFQIVKLLNQQDKELSKLRASYQQVKEENSQLKQQLHDLPNKIVGEIKQQLFNHFKVKNIEEYEKLSLIDALFTADTVIEILDTILKKYGGEDEINFN